MLIRYRGGRKVVKVILNRVSYIFSKENDRMLDITDQKVINYVFSLPNREEFEVVVEDIKVSEVSPIVKEPEEEGFKCDVCGFVSKTDLGLKSHSRKHKKEEIE